MMNYFNKKTNQDLILYINFMIILIIIIIIFFLILLNANNLLHEAEIAKLNAIREKEIFKNAIQMLALKTDLEKQALADSTWQFDLVYTFLTTVVVLALCGCGYSYIASQTNTSILVNKVDTVEKAVNILAHKVNIVEKTDNTIINIVNRIEETVGFMEDKLMNVVVRVDYLAETKYLAAGVGGVQVLVH